MNKPYYENTAADKQQVGFHYQDFVCLKYLLNLQQGEKVGLEVFDDVHHERITGVKELVQVKHSITEGAKLTNKDEDFWKTVYNWIRALSDLQEENISFLFYANKIPTEKPGIISLLLQGKYEKAEVENALDEMLVDARGKTLEDKSPMGTNDYISYFCTRPKEQQHRVLENTKFVFSETPILDELKRKIETFGVPQNNSQELLDQIIGIFTRKKYEHIKNNKKLVISYEQFRKEFQFDGNLQLVRSRELKFQRYNNFRRSNDINPYQGLFSKQLQDIKISKEKITDYAIEYAKTSMFLEKLKIDGDYTDSEDIIFETEVTMGWESIHTRTFDCDVSDTEQLQRLARSVLSDTTELNVSVSNENVGRALVKGKSIELSDKAQIGWIQDWQKRYKNIK